MSSTKSPKTRRNRRNHLRLKRREAIAAFKQTELGQKIVRGVAAQQAAAASAAK